MNASLSNEDAIQNLSEVVETLRAKNDPARLQLALGTLGKALMRSGDMLKGLTCFDEAAAIAQQLGDVQSEALHSGNQGFALAQIGNFDMALRALRRAQSLGRRVNQPGIVYDSLLAMASVEINRDNPDQAVDYLQEALEIAQENGDAQREVNALMALAQAYWETGEIEASVGQYQAAFDLATRLGKTDLETECCDRLASLYHRLEDFRAECAILRQAIAKLPAEGAAPGWFLRLGDASLELDEWSDADQAYRQAYSLAGEQANLPAMSRALGGLSVVNAEQDRLVEAHDYALQAVQAAQPGENADLYAEQLILLAFSKRDLGHTDQAAETAHQALQIFIQTENFAAEQRVRRFLDELEGN